MNNDWALATQTDEGRAYRKSNCDLVDTDHHGTLRVHTSATIQANVVTTNVPILSP